MNIKKQSLFHQIRFWMFICLVFMLSACNLGNAPSRPPTLVPRASTTPPATLGFNGSYGSQLELAPSDLSIPISNIDVEFYNLLAQVDSDRLRLHVETLQGFTTRHVNSVQDRPDYGIGATRDYIYTEFEQIAQESEGRIMVQLQPFEMNYNGIRTQQNNIVGVINGTTPGAGFLVIGSHYDSILSSDFADATSFAPEANDGLSGIAALLEIMRILSQHQYRSSIIFVAFSGEEVGRLGSRAFVSWASQSNIDINGMINIDSVGNSYNLRSDQTADSLRIFSCLEESFCRDNGLSRQMARNAELLAFVHTAPLIMSVEPQADRTGRFGDHFSFSEVGYPAIRFTDSLEEWGNGSTQDTIEYMEFDHLQRSTQSIMLIAIALANGLSPPRSIVLRTNEVSRTTLVWDSVPDAHGYIIALRSPNSQNYNAILEVPADQDTAFTWEGFTSPAWTALAIAPRNSNGLVGQLSQEFILPTNR